ncbi:hypothetical protein [Paenibacillus cremeus]|uniref:Uncharacterized protein n=1 Tax=Paenibacillus cremeus TaxID=2163881 RepID=A0A559KBW5_9BACL|nr:hypothetical protein [Paenibacillus cremeus]TVY09624.1 hypothetical protein FPZ49_12875 [Paenibacillus cremeus]
MQLRDALFNWLQISIVSEARPEDNAARETRDFFELILREDHGLNRFSVTADDMAYHILYETGGQSVNQKFDREAADQLLEDINSNPKYNE